MPLEAGFFSLGYSLARDLIGFLTGGSRKRTERGIRSRERWKDAIHEYLLDIWSKGLRTEIIIRDFARLKQYPDCIDGKGISPWFKVSLLELYHNGIKVGLRTSRLVFEESEGMWRKSAQDEEEGSIIAYLVGFVPFENIESVDFEGDEYYSFPHVICHFDKKRQPYERLAYCEAKTLDEKRFFYTEIATWNAVNLTSAKFGTHQQW
jgi:hypothetical protein